MKAETKIYRAYLKSKKSKLYFNQLKELTSLSNSSLQNILNKLVETHSLKIEKTKSNTYYHIQDKKCFTLKFSEIAIERFKELNLNVRRPLKNFLKEVTQDIFTIILFGSASQKKEQKNSDIDLLIVSNKNQDFEKLKAKVNATSNYPLSIAQCSVKKFIKHEDHLIVQAIKTGFPIYKEQNFYEVMLNEY